jgi:hypothetical protein
MNFRLIAQPKLALSGVQSSSVLLPEKMEKSWALNLTVQLMRARLDGPYFVLDVLFFAAVCLAALATTFLAAAFFGAAFFDGAEAIAFFEAFCVDPPVGLGALVIPIL